MSTTTNNNNSIATTGGTNISAQKADRVAEFAALIKGITTDLTNVDPFVLAGQSLPRTLVLGRLQARIDAAEKTKAARTAFHLAVEDERAVALDADQLRADLKVWLQAHFGSKSTRLQEFGFTPRKPNKKSAVAKAEGAARAKATRTVRGTKGKKQKKGLRAPAQTVQFSSGQPEPLPAPPAPNKANAQS
jgi:hypothetical protein